MNNDLIDRLAADLEPVSSRRPRRRLQVGLVAGAVVVFVAFLLMPGLVFRTDLASAATGVSFWMKAGFTGAMAGTGAWAAMALSRPGGRTIADRGVALAVWLVIAAVAAGILVTTPPAEWMRLALGDTARRCLSYILLLSIPPLGLILFVMRRAAPTRLTRAGWAAGLTAGGLGATVYSLGCGETSPVFLALWYAMGIALVGLCGAVAGRWALRW